MSSFQFSFNDTGKLGAKLSINDQTTSISFTAANVLCDFIRATLLMHSKNPNTAILSYPLSPDTEHWVFENPANILLKKVISNEDEGMDKGSIDFRAGTPLIEFTRSLIEAAENCRKDFDNKDVNFNGFEFPELELTALKATL